ncbi:hypothetical protein [Agromyces sp. NPDC058064]|uniref:hypothetical protein n=1 Tax=Agromyces sp. NPDC058064 TaxID=3346322 RepID=UPI0036DD568A
MQQITAYADGVYGPGPFYWIDPLAADMNVLPQSWATPSLAGYDAVPFAGDDRPVLAPQTDQSQRYPSEKAAYTLAADTPMRSLYIPIPPGHVAWVGVHGDADATGRVKVTPFEAAVAGTAEHPTILSVATSVRVNTMVEGTGLELALDNTDPGTCTLAGLIVQVLREGVSPATGGFIPGQGHAGCKFDPRLTEIPLVIDGDQSFVQLSGKLVEVG